MNWLNIADVNATLLNILGGVTTVEAYRYLSDWKLVRDAIINITDRSEDLKRDQFKIWAMHTSGRPDRTILRISRLIATAFRVKTGKIDHLKELLIRDMVAEELQALKGPRFERFCFRFARFCKLDYALRFFLFAHGESSEIKIVRP